MKSTTVLYRYNDMSRKNGFYSLNIKHAAITGAIYTLVSTNKHRVRGLFVHSIRNLYRNITYFVVKVRQFYTVEGSTRSPISQFFLLFFLFIYLHNSHFYMLIIYYHFDGKLTTDTAKI